MSDPRRDWLQEIARWKLEAADEDNSRYFYGFPSVTAIQSGDISYVIGRKGSGKTAVAEHIRGSKSHNTFVRSLSFKNFPFNELYALSDSSFTSPSQYTTLWKYIIYSAVCSMLADNASIDATISGEISKYFALDVEKGLARSVNKINDRSGGFTLFGTGANAALKSISVPNDASWQERADILERVILEFIDDSNYFILFDELDEDYKDVLEISVSRNYFDLLIGLFKAAHDIRRKMRSDTNVRPVIFLREDIYDLLRDNDKNKWRDSAITLSWSESQLRDLTAFRLSRALNQQGSIRSFQSVIEQLFTTEETRAGGARSRRHVFQYILKYTLGRPRDIISYLRECARFALGKNSDRVSPNNFSEVNRAYSRRLREEFVDEIQGAIPHINEVFEILSRMRKQIFTFVEFRREYDASVLRNEFPDLPQFDLVCKILFLYSAIGNQPSQGSAKIFRFIYPNARINFSENAVIHPGLLQSLQIN